MGSYDGAEACELVSLYLLDQLSREHEKPDIGLYRDDGLAIMCNSNPQKSDQARKQITRIFKDVLHRLQIQENHVLCISAIIFDQTFIKLLMSQLG